MANENWTVVKHSWSDTSISDSTHVICASSIEGEATEENQDELEARQAKEMQLCAAAPELLYVLQGIANSTAEKSTRDLARRAIEKATGATS